MKLIAEPNGSALQHLIAFQHHRAKRSRCTDFIIARVENTRRTSHSIGSWKDDKAYLIDETRAKEGAVGNTATLEQQAPDLQFPVQDLEGQSEIEIVFTGENVGNTILA
jgi:hypothetical protein